MSSRPVVYLLDAHYQIFRAYHSVPDLRAPDGSPVGALRGSGTQFSSIKTGRWRARTTWRAGSSWGLDGDFCDLFELDD